MKDEVELSNRCLVALMAAYMPTPDKETVAFEARKDALANPHGDTYKPRRRSVREIEAWLRVRAAKDVLEMVETGKLKEER